ncbi:energy transducer TonB [Phorcysia thermohydrogeniphila]|uniref:Outer membrane transport energization protein TonB n=1 Tax=Phorcysia thermohydrogeniphila TaxID=936138 RepID=A0A4V2PD13_9BACT|nr:energy transducer TonB [Phorcysia thermohydrogeniphila]TCK03436.1 outer membrane transport energization protein TonB [Phorcysia thermohydrogeniphila]
MNKSLILSAVLSLTLHLFVLSFLFQQESYRAPVNQENSVTLSFLEEKREEKEKKGTERKQEQQKRVKIQRKRTKPSHPTLQKTQKSLRPPEKPKRTKETKQKKSNVPQKETKTTKTTKEALKEPTSPKNIQSNTPEKPPKGTQKTEEKRKLQKSPHQESPIEGEKEREKPSVKRSSRTSHAVKKEFNREKYISMLVAEIERRKFYPPIARRMGIEGVVKVRITLDRSGKLREVRVTSSSGSKILDRAAVKLMKKCQFPPLPPEYDKREFSVEIPIRYTLK